MTQEFLSPAAVAASRRPLAQAYTLPPVAYTDPGLWHVEKARVLARSWLPLARVDQVPGAGDYLSADLGGEPVMVVRGEDGTVRVLSRVCRHRAALVAEGQGCRKLFTCPYHAWSYDTKGSLVRAPLMEGAEGFDPVAHGLREIRSEIWEGFIMATLDADAPAFAPQVSGFADYFANYNLGSFVVARTLDYSHGWNWKVLAENFMEAYHHIAAHSKTLEPGYHARDSQVPDTDQPWSILHMPAADRDTPQPPVPGLEDWQLRDLIAANAFPGLLLAVQGPFMAWYQMTPLAADRLDLKIHLCFPDWMQSLDDYAAIVDGAEASIRGVHEEDIAANDLVWAGLNAPLSRAGPLSPLEKSIWQMNQWWLDRMGA
ncbi:aromatic ring-hydroxylating dioxygenase subunit alpha [Hyphomonas jannaschiana]|uniref:aromatic ring-hydroxylating dioxygenase subunit alpha n=1 Tax=Hyphomonas jannaschiana TaxID=86 RepID=UPI0035C72F01